MPVAADGEWEVAGLRIGASTRYPVESVTGLGVPEAKTVDSDVPSDDGAWSGDDRMAPREVIIEVGVDGDPDTSAYGNRIRDLAAAAAPRSADVVASFQRFGVRRRLYCRPRGLIVPWDDDFHLGATHAELRLFCPDPRVYDDDETATVVAGTANVTNAGNRATWPVLTITTPGDEVSLTNNTTGETVTLIDTTPGTPVVDFKRRDVRIGGVDYYSGVQAGSKWWQLVPGVNSITVGGAASASVAFRSAWASG